MAEAVTVGLAYGISAYDACYVALYERNTSAAIFSYLERGTVPPVSAILAQLPRVILCKYFI